MDKSPNLAILSRVLEEHIEEYGLDIVLDALFDAVLHSKRLQTSAWERDRVLAKKIVDLIPDLMLE
jgi:hypothetical protein